MAVEVTVSSSLNSFASQSRFNVDVSINELKSRLELITGASCSTMQLELFSDEGKFIKRLDDDSATLSSCNVMDKMRIHVIENDPLKKKGEFEDTSQVEKYEMSEEDYSKRIDSIRMFLKQKRLAQGVAGQDNDASNVDEERLAAEAITVGSRCEVTLPGLPPRRGLVMFVGKTQFKPGYWVGVKYDEPHGKNDGSIAGHRYFECPPKYGAFIKPKSVQVGDYPEETFSDDEM
ncbi:tubulin-folding cofactor B-like isoform X2 [Dysidea avara]|uniref:tubulin-folding cofactor B-like isoform X2 n=1 Tax=Dysidea avara TaxID=196820 RepID=UPI00332BDC77